MVAARMASTNVSGSSIQRTLFMARTLRSVSPRDQMSFYLNDIDVKYGSVEMQDV